MKETVYIDGDGLPYRVGFATQRTIYSLNSEGEHSCSPFLVTKSKRTVNKYMKYDCVSYDSHEFVEDFTLAVNTLKMALRNIVQGSGCNAFKVVLSDEENNFRNEIATIQPYKGNRDGGHKPHHWRGLRDWLLSKSYTIIAEGEEADDYVSRMMMQGYVGASNDKDLNNTPGWHYNYAKGEKYYVTEAEAMRNFYTQCLTGDATDNIPGLRGVGPARAAKILGESESSMELEARVLDAYGKSYDNPVEALTEVGRLLWMRREEGELWTPITS